MAQISKRMPALRISSMDAECWQNAIRRGRLMGPVKWKNLNGFCSISVFATAKTCIEFQKVGHCLRIPQAVCNHWPVAISTNVPGILAFAAYLGKHHIHPYHGPYPSISGLNTHLHTFTATFDLFFPSSWLNLYFRWNPVDEGYSIAWVGSTWTSAEVP